MKSRFLPFVAVVLIPALALLLPAGGAWAEPYVGFYLTGVPSSEHQVKADRTFIGTGTTDKFTVNDARFGSSVVYGGVVGYRFFPFLGAEIDAYHLSPGLKAQTRPANSPSAGSTTVTTREGDLDFTVLAIGPVGSYSFLPDQAVPEGRLQLYAGAGLAIFFSSVDATGSTAFAQFTMRDSDTSVGPHVKAGVRWFFSRNLAAFIEGRYAHTSIDFQDTGVTFAGAPIRLKTSTDVDLPLGLAGVSWHFR